MRKNRTWIESIEEALEGLTSRVCAGADSRKRLQGKRWIERIDPWLWRLSKPMLERILAHEERRIENGSQASTEERRRTESLRRAVKHYNDRDWLWRYWCLRLRSTSALQDGGPTKFFDLWETLPPERLAVGADEAEARRRAELTYITHLQAIAHGRTGLSVAALSQPMPSDPEAPASSEAVLRMLWLWVGFITYDETLSGLGEEAVKRFLKRAWPKYHGSRVTRGLLETWVQYAQDIKYERDAQACYGGRGWDPRRKL